MEKRHREREGVQEVVAAFGEHGERVRRNANGTLGLQLGPTAPGGSGGRCWPGVSAETPCAQFHKP
jgi:hypothetical protein